MRHAFLLAALAALSVISVSCADMPTAPRATVQVTGSIMDRNGTGIQAVYVIFEDLAPRSAHTDPASYFTVTDLNGLYSVSMPEGTYRVWLDPPAFSGYGSTVLDSRTVTRSSTRIDYRCNFVRLAVHPTISGWQTAADLRVSVHPELVGFWGQDMRLAGSDRELFVPPGQYRLEAVLEGRGFGYVRQYLSVPVSAADTTLSLVFSGNAVTGHVTGQGGLPFQDGVLYAVSPFNGAQGRLDANGAATLYLPSDTYRITVYSSHSNIMGRFASNVVVNGDASLNFDLSGTQWSGVVRRVSDGTPLGGMEVAAELSEGYLGASFYTDTDGAFDLVVQTGHLYTIDVVDLQTGNVLQHLQNVPAGADSTFDLMVDPASPVQGAAAPDLKRAPPAGRDAPASAAAGRGSPRRSSRTSG